MALLTCENVSFAYENQIVVKNLNFSIGEGDYLCITGENGTGKTTLMKGLLGLKKPFSGKITVSDGLRPTEIGYVPQQTAVSKDFPASVYEVVLSGCLNRRGLRPGYGRADQERALLNMELLNITALKKRSFRELSGGQRQRVLLARSLCATSKLLLLDEPTTGLDPLVTGEFYDLIEKLNIKHNITIVMVSHEVRIAVGKADHILHLSHKDYFFGTAQEYEKSVQGRRFLAGKE